MASSHPHWNKPTPPKSTVLKVFNSLTSTLDDFIPIKPNQISWYACGPTVYASAHLGHARAYMTFDIIRRILEDHFRFDVHCAMNVTDIDDKIICRARRLHLLRQYAAGAPAAAAVAEKSAAAIEFCISKANANLAAIDRKRGAAKGQQKAEYESAAKGEAMKLAAMVRAERELTKAESGRGVMKEDFFDENCETYSVVRDALAEYLDNEKGGEITDHSIFNKHSKKYEKEFLEDMAALDIRPPDCLTRVTEFIPEIIGFIEGIIKNGFGYESNGSVYFDIAAFKENGHFYPKLCPKQFGNELLLNEAEGSLCNTAGNEKKSSHDFALWKRSRAGEPFWTSPWGNGRPGWHIECSVMASTALGKNFDIHSGGEDLRFPHHDNEIAQAEAYYRQNSCPPVQWANYFLHAGHLGINGLKMAKSLKNFITIRQALKTHSAHQIRLCFLLQGWNKKMEYSTDALIEAVAKEKTLFEFISTAESVMRSLKNISKFVQKWDVEDTKLNEFVLSAQNKVGEYFCDNFDYCSAVHCLFEVINVTNKYINAANPPKYLLLLKTLNFLTKTFKTLGMLQSASTGHLNAENDAFVEIFDLFCHYRQQLRLHCLSAAPLENSDFEPESVRNRLNEKLQNAISAQSARNPLFGDSDFAVIKKCAEFLRSADNGVAAGKDKSYFLALCDAVRDEELTPFGIKIEDATAADKTSKSLWKRVDAELLVKERAEKKEIENKNAIQRLENQLTEKMKTWEKYKIAVLSLKERFVLKYGENFVYEEGRETPAAILGQSEPLSKSAKKKFEKDVKVFGNEAEWARKVGESSGSGGFPVPAEEEIERIRNQLAQLKSSENGETAKSR